MDSTPVSKMFPRRQSSLVRTAGPKSGAGGLGRCARLCFTRIVSVDSVGGGQPGGSLEVRKAEVVTMQRREPHKGGFTGGLAGDSGRLDAGKSERRRKQPCRFRFRAVSPLAVMLQTVRRRRTQGRRGGRERVCFEHGEFPSPVGFARGIFLNQLQMET